MTVTYSPLTLLTDTQLLKHQLSVTFAVAGVHLPQRQPRPTQPSIPSSINCGCVSVRLASGRPKSNVTLTPWQQEVRIVKRPKIDKSAITTNEPNRYNGQWQMAEILGTVKKGLCASTLTSIVRVGTQPILVVSTQCTNSDKSSSTNRQCVISISMFIFWITQICEKGNICYWNTEQCTRNPITTRNHTTITYTWKG